MYVKIPKITTANNSKSCKTSDVVIAVTPFLYTFVQRE